MRVNTGVRWSANIKRRASIVHRDSVLVTARIYTRNISGYLGQIDHALASCAAKRNYRRIAGLLADMQHLQRVLCEIEHYADLLFEFRPGKTDRHRGILNIGTINRDPCLKSRGENAVFMRDLGQLAAHQM